MIVADGNQFGAVSYLGLRVNQTPSRFIEDGRVPSDAQIVDYTWQYTNKKGGPDRRFSNNRQLPICLYDSLHLSSPSGLNEPFEFSRAGVSRAMDVAVDDMRRAGAPSPAPPLSPASAIPGSRWPLEDSTPAESPPPRKRSYAGKVAIGVVLAGILYALLMPPREATQSGFPKPTRAISAPVQTVPAATPAVKAQEGASNAPSQDAIKAEPPAPPPKDDRSLSMAEVRELQERLRALGFDPGGIDGMFGPQTAAAIKHFEASVSLPTQGNPDRATLQRVRDAKPAR